MSIFPRSPFTPGEVSPGLHPGAFSLSLTLIGSDEDEDEVAHDWAQQEEKINCDMNEVSPGLFIGSARCTTRPGVLSAKGIQCAVNASQRPVSLPGMDVHVVDLKDDDSSSPGALHEKLRACHAFMARASGPVLVFCHRGISRSATILGTYLMARDSIGWVAALERIKQHRSSVAPNLYFLKQMYVFEKSQCSWETCTSQYTQLATDFESTVKDTTWGTEKKDSTPQ